MITLFSGAALYGAVRGWLGSSRGVVDQAFSALLSAFSAVFFINVALVVIGLLRWKIGDALARPTKPPPRRVQPSRAQLTDWFVSHATPDMFDAYAAVYFAATELGRSRDDAELAATRAIHDQAHGDELAKREAAAAIASAWDVISERDMEDHVAALRDALEEERAEHVHFMKMIEAAPASNEIAPPEPEIPRLPAGSLTPEEAVRAHKAAIAELEWLNSEAGQLHDDASSEECRAWSERLDRAVFAVVDTDPARHQR